MQKQKISNTLYLVAFFLLMSISGHSQVPVNLKCEYLVNPLGIDVTKPRLSWQLSGSGSNVLQTAYQIEVASSPDALSKGTDIIWDTGKTSSAAILTSYNGLPLKSFTAYFCRVKVWDGNNKMKISKIQRFETAILESNDWKGSWISDSNDMNYKPAPYFRKETKTL